MKLRVLALALAILAFFIFVGSPFQQAAKAVALVDDAIIAIVIAALAACGITFVTTGAYGNLKEYVSNMIRNYCEDNGTTTTALFNGVQYGKNNIGQILLNNRFLQVISVIVEYIKFKLGLTNNSNVTIQRKTAMLGNLEFTQLPIVGVGHNPNNGQSSEAIIEPDRSTSPVYVVFAQNRGEKFVVSNNDGYVKVTVRKYDSRNNLISESVNTYHLTKDNWWEISSAQIDYAITEAATGMTTTWNPSVESYNIYDIMSAINTYSQIYSTEGISVRTGVIEAPDDKPEYDDSKGGVLDVGATWGEDLGNIIDDTIPGDFSEGKEGSAELFLEDEVAVQDQVEEASGNMVSQQVGDYQVNGLVSVFPFCIPFDLYNFVACLAADPVAPSFTWRFYVPGICDESIEIDLSEFDAAAQILRTMELLLFCVGLAFVTRKIIRG